MTMPEEPEKQSDRPRNGLREFSIWLLRILLCFIGIVAILAVLAGMILPQIGRMKPKSAASVCKIYLEQANRIILDHYRKELEKEDSSFSRDSTVSAVIQAFILQNPSGRNLFCCQTPGAKKAYLAFPAPVFVMSGESIVEPPVPVLMCPPDCFHKKIGINVLYSDGMVRTIPREEAEKLVSEYSPVPIELDFEAQPEGGK